MNCRDFIIEFEERSPLSETSVLHLRICSDCQKLSEQQTQIWQAIEDFRKVAAPTDFDFKVKARIARSDAAKFQPRFFPALRYVLPLGLIVLLLGAAILNFVNFSGGNLASPIAEKVPQNPTETKISPADNSKENQSVAADFNSKTANESVAETSRNAAANNQSQFVAVKLPPTTRLLKSVRQNESDDDGGSRKLASTSAPIFTPQNLNANQPVKTSPDAMRVNSLTYDQILSELGIETILENGKRKVEIVKENSLAERADVKVGDILEEIDGKPIDEKAGGKQIEIKKITVVRNAKKIEINLQGQLK